MCECMWVCVCVCVNLVNALNGNECVSSTVTALRSVRAGERVWSVSKARSSGVQLVCPPICRHSGGVCSGASDAAVAAPLRSAPPTRALVVVVNEWFSTLCTGTNVIGSSACTSSILSLLLFSLSTRCPITIRRWVCVCICCHCDCCTTVIWGGGVVVLTAAERKLKQSI